jgi:signal peptidase II
MAILALTIFAFDQLTKLVALHFLDQSEEKIVLSGFFKFVHWTNTGAAWSLFRDNNGLLAIVSAVALVALALCRRRFEPQKTLGWISLGLIFGGIAGNLLDRVYRDHVVDFIYFYVDRREGGELGFPAFNVADSAICIGVGLLFLLTFRSESAAPAAEETKS